MECISLCGIPCLRALPASASIGSSLHQLESFLEIFLWRLCNLNCYCVDREQEQIDQLPGDKKGLFTQLQCCEEDLKRANECEK